MTSQDNKAKLGIYGKGSYDVTKARADVKKALEEAANKFSKTKAYNCTIHPQPQQPKAEASDTDSKMLGSLGKAAMGMLAKEGSKAQKHDHAHDATATHPSSAQHDSET